MTHTNEVDPRCHDVWHELVAAQGAIPAHNVFVETARLRGVSRTKARKDYHSLRGPTSRPPDQEARVPTVPPSVSPDERPAWALALQELPGRLGRLEARVASQEHALQAVEAQVRALMVTMEQHHRLFMTVQEFFELLRKDDDAWQTADSLLQTGSTATRGVLHQFVAAKAQRPRPLKYLRQ